MKKFIKIAVVMGASLVFSVVPAKATGITLVNDTGIETFLPSGDTDSSSLSGGLTNNFTFVGYSSPSGSITSYAFTGDALNPYGSGDLTFVYNVADFNDEVNTIDLNGFDLSSVQIGYNGSGTGLFAADLSSSGGVLDISFSANITSGQSSDNIFIYTSATQIFDNTSYAIDNGDSDAAQILAPSEITEAPEPGVLSLMGTGLAGLLSLRIFHKRQ